MRFTLIGRLTNVQTIAAGRSIRTLNHLQRRFGHGRWRKMKGTATVELVDGRVRDAELHWYEAHGIGRVLMKVKRYAD